MWSSLITDITEVINQGAFLNLVINSRIDKLKENDKKLYTKIMYGVIDYKNWLDFLLRPYISGKRFKPHLKNALRIATYALTYLSLAKFYVVTSIVDVVKKKDYNGSKAINGILRSFIRDERFNVTYEALKSLPALDAESIKFNIDKDVLMIIKRDYPNDYQDILKVEDETYNSYRINYILTKKDDVENYLKEHNISYEINDENIITKSSLINTPLFKEHLIVAQDASSIRVAKLLSPSKGSTVLDVCSAPGSKSFHLATILNNTGQVIACDIYEHKLKLIEEGASMQGIKNIKTQLLDARCVTYGAFYEYILVDAPCSGMGTMKHKSDLKLRLTKQKIDEIIALQKEILENVSKYLMTNGIMVYSTCTINKDENERQIEKFIKTHPNFKILEEYSFLPNAFQDGFYMCKLKKVE